MKKYILQLGLMAGVLGMVTQSRGALYNLSFTGTQADSSVVTASGQLDVNGGVATGGFLDVLSGPNAGDYTLVPGQDLNTSDTFTYDSLVSPGSTPFLNQVNQAGGLLWANGGTEINMWYNTPAESATLSGSGYYSVPNEYALWGYNGAYAPQAYGDASLTLAAVPVPEASATSVTTGLAAVGLLVLVAGRKKLAKAA